MLPASWRPKEARATISRRSSEAESKKTQPEDEQTGQTSVGEEVEMERLPSRACVGAASADAEMEAEGNFNRLEFIRRHINHATVSPFPTLKLRRRARPLMGGLARHLLLGRHRLLLDRIRHHDKFCVSSVLSLNSSVVSSLADLRRLVSLSSM